ncbi:MAG: hypothetical protein OET44_09925 [Gammaproteobacteria bacterium]|nr:hypothetical protein [Gammaproteobacteria bacterium]
MKHEIDDETLTAYVDGELDDASATEVKSALLRDPELRRHAERLHGSAQALRGAFDELLAEPVPAEVLDVLERERSKSPVQGRKHVVQLAIAASFALVIGSLSGFWFAHTGPSSSSVGAWPGALEAASSGLFDTTPSGALVQIDSGLELQPVLSFRDRNGRICRQYVITDTRSSGATADGVACRTGNDRWQVEFARLRNPAPASSPPGFAPASGGDSGTFNAAVNALVADPVAPEQERELIRSNWR